MNGKLAKQVRRVTAHPGLSAEPIYDQIEVKTIQYEDVMVHKIQVVLSRQCNRYYSQFFKNNLKRIRNGMQPRSLLGV